VTTELTVGILAQLLPGSAGGVETNLLALLRALAGREDGAGQVIIGPGGQSDWLRAHLGPRQTLLPWPVVHAAWGTARPRRPAIVANLAKRLLGRRRYGLRRAVGGLRHRLGIGPPSSAEALTEMLRGAGVRLVHFPYQRLFPTALPTLFEPWDLQHRHYPEFFTADEIELREDLYRFGCRTARLIVTASHWTKRDLVRQFDIDPRKIAVIPRGPAPGLRQRVSKAEGASRVQHLSLPEHFALYPAKTWPHKNHLRLFEALASLRDQRGLVVPLVCTARPVADHSAVLTRTLEALALEKQVLFTGHLPQPEMDALFSLADLMIFPSLFEGFGIPLLEAMHFGLPIVCSNGSCLPEVAGDAALYFDPLSVESIADAVAQAWQTPALWEEYRRRGIERVRRFSWTDAAGRFLACYHHAAGDPLTSAQRAMLDAMTAPE
jgi:glycosyltransferase involved in cell wall biosynthesis